MNNDTTIGQNLGSIRRAHVDRPSQFDLAAHLGLSRNTIQKYESGMTRVPAECVPRIASFLGCSIMDLFEGTTP